jgi:hypothetical protein
MKPAILFHGSSRPLKGETLNPSQGKDDASRPENNYLAVYATDRKDLAIVMAIIGCEDVIGGSIDGYENGKLIARIHGAYPKQEYIYLHHLSSEDFSQTEIDTHQFVNFKAVKPLKTEKIRVKDYTHLAPLASKEETLAWQEKYKDIN